jgi:hypothetical protein
MEILLKGLGADGRLKGIGSYANSVKVLTAAKGEAPVVGSCEYDRQLSYNNERKRRFFE